LSSLKHKLLNLAKSTADVADLSAAPRALESELSHPFLIGYAWLPLGDVVPAEAWVDLVASKALRSSELAQLSELKLATGFQACGIHQATSLIVPVSWTVTERLVTPPTHAGVGQPLPILSSGVLRMSSREICGYEDLYSGLDQDGTYLSKDSTAVLLESLEMLRRSRERCVVVDGLGILETALMELQTSLDERVRICQKLQEDRDEEAFMKRMGSLTEQLSKSKILIALYRGMHKSLMLLY
jgi:hypothetical protein